MLFVLPKNQKVSSRVSNEVEYIVEGGSLGLYQKEIKRGNGQQILLNYELSIFSFQFSIQKIVPIGTSDNR